MGWKFLVCSEIKPVFQMTSRSQDFCCFPIQASKDPPLGGWGNRLAEREGGTAHQGSGSIRKESKEW